jgi:hypothetical protein
VEKRLRQPNPYGLGPKRDKERSPAIKEVGPEIGGIRIGASEIVQRMSIG